MEELRCKLRESFKYVIINVFASALFVIAIALLYSVTGTLNMAHIAQRVAELEQTGILNVIAILFMIVFGMKGALFPLSFSCRVPIRSSSSHSGLIWRIANKGWDLRPDSELYINF